MIYMFVLFICLMPDARCVCVIINMLYFEPFICLELLDTVAVVCRKNFDLQIIAIHFDGVRKDGSLFILTGLAMLITKSDKER